MISSFDILAYAYLKEELVNTEDSGPVCHLKKQKDLMNFIKNMDAWTKLDPVTGQSPLSESERNHLKIVKSDPAVIEREVDSKFR